MELVTKWKADLEFIILHHGEEGGVLPAGRVHYAAQGGGETLLKYRYFKLICLIPSKICNISSKGDRMLEMEGHLPRISC